MRKKTSRFRWAVGLPVGNAFAEPEVSTGLRYAFIRTLVSLQLIVTSRAPSTIRRNLAFQDTANICKKKPNNPDQNRANAHFQKSSNNPRWALILSKFDTFQKFHTI